MVGLCAGAAEDAPDLAAQLLGEEPFVLIPNHLDVKDFPKSGKIEVMTIEPSSATWATLGPRLKRAQARWPFRLEVTRTLQSFSCLVELARAGHGHALVPGSVARAVGVPASACIALPAPGLSRPVSVVARPTMLAQPLVQTFARALTQAAAQVLVV
jgi:DNA-binding transcriptional LysR family regulator